MLCVRLYRFPGMKNYKLLILVIVAGLLRIPSAYGLNLYSVFYPPYGISEKDGLLVELARIGFKDQLDMKILTQPLARSVTSYVTEKTVLTGGLETVPPDVIRDSEVINLIDADIHFIYSRKTYPKKLQFTPDILKKKKIVILLGSKAIFTEVFKGKNINLLELPDPDALFRVVGSGRADFGLCAILACYAKLQELNIQGLEVMYGPLINVHGVILIHKSNPHAKELANQVRKNLKAAFASGEVQKIVEKYHFGNPVLPQTYRYLQAL